MNNHEAFEYLIEYEKPAIASRNYIELFNLDNSNFNTLKNKFNRLKTVRQTYLRRKDLSTWEAETFFENNYDTSIYSKTTIQIESIPPGLNNLLKCSKCPV